VHPITFFVALICKSKTSNITAFANSEMLVGLFCAKLIIEIITVFNYFFMIIILVSISYGSIKKNIGPAVSAFG
jgi:hypothetical protein